MAQTRPTGGHCPRLLGGTGSALLEGARVLVRAATPHLRKNVSNAGDCVSRSNELRKIQRIAEAPPVRPVGVT